jgi:ribulose 1,5-bisphosphate carboxylase large subunit-like protein
MIKVQVAARLSRLDNKEAPTGNDIEASIDQCVADAVEGSFGDYPAHTRRLVTLRAKRLANGGAEPRISERHADVRFSFGLPTELFPVTRGGLQHLVNVLAGDMFPSVAAGCRWSEIEVEDVELPAEMCTAAQREYRTSAHDIEALRAMFRLEARRPLLAFSFKPRVGLSFADTRRITLDVLRAGFNIVELDARNLVVNADSLDRWADLGMEAAGCGESHVTAFAPNFSMPAPQLTATVASWAARVAPYGPTVVKVDGGLDGLSGLQAIRSAKLSVAPVLTSYPILRKQLASAIGKSTWVNMLSLSGADVIYPGNRPTFLGEPRPVWGAGAEDILRAARTYDSMIETGWPMPTIAGGVHPGLLHACYELLGPNVAYFLGGAVALHPTSARAGAAMCVEVLESAIELAQQAEHAGADHAGDLPRRLLARVERTRYPISSLNYASPVQIFGGTDGKTKPRPFYRRPH